MATPPASVSCDVRVSVVIPCRNEARYIARTLEAVASQAHPIEEVVVVDGGSTDGTRELLERFRQARPAFPLTIVAGPAGAIPVSLNLGVARARGDVIVRFDAHSIPDRTYVNRAVRGLADPNVGVVGGRWDVQSGDTTAVAAAIAAAVRHPLGAGDAAYRVARRDTGVREVESVPFGCYRRDLWERLGGYAEDLDVAEDYEFNHRVRDSGLRVMLDTAMNSTYFARPTVRALARQYFRYGWWKGEVFRRFPGAWRPRTLAPAALVLTVIGLAVAATAAGTFLWALLAVIGLYAGAMFVGALQAASERPRHAPLVAWSFVVLHVAQGSGLLLNLLARERTRRFA